MSRFLTTLPFLAALALGQPALAQSTTATEEETTTQTEATTAAGTEAETASGQTNSDIANEDLALGENLDAERPKLTVKATHGDWELQCIEIPPAEEGGEVREDCQLYQLLKNAEGVSVAEISMFRLPKGGQAVSGATLIVPLETLLTAQITVAVDGAKGKRYPFAFCNPIGCYARVGLTAKDIASFKRGAKATVTLVPASAPDQKVVLNMSLKGFTAGFDATSVVDQ